MKVSKQNAEHYVWGGKCDGWHLVKNQNLSIIHERMPPHTKEVRHCHTKAHQFFFMLKGTAALEVDGVIYDVKAHEGVEVLPSILHQIMNLSSEEIEFLVISQPFAQGDRIAVCEEAD
jgi:mannose-6-phosphate isomerase-like protein (cupin superfamily)